MKTLITTYANVALTVSPQYTTLETFLEAQKKPEQRVLSTVQRIRAETDKATVRELKTKLLPIACPSGTFSSRKDSALKVSSGLVCLDVDAASDVISLKNEVKDCENVVSAFLSPSGNGLKILVRHDLKNTELFPALYRQLGEHLGLTGRSDLKFDSSCQNISHPCFFSYDRNIYINRKAKPYEVDEDLLAKTPSPVKAPDTLDDMLVYKDPLTDYREIRSRVKESHDLFERYHSLYPGTRNTGLYILASFFRQDGIPEDFATDYLVAYYSDGEFSPKEISRTIKSAYNEKQ